MSHDLDPRLADRLRRVADPVEGADWADVRRRAQSFAEARRRRRAGVALAAALALVLVMVIPAFGVGSRLLEVLSLAETETEVPAAPGAALVPPYVYADALYGVGDSPQELGGLLVAPLLGQYDVPLAIPSPDGRFVVYHSASGADPTTSLRVHDTKTGEERVLARSAQSFAWSRDGAVAYWQAASPRYTARRPYLGRVVVRRSLQSPPVPWTGRAGGYTVLGWARDRLLVRSRACLLEGCDNLLTDGVYVLRGPDSMRPLPLADVAAISPDGRLAIGGWVPVPGQDSPSPFVRVVEIASGRVLVHRDLRRILRRSVAAGRVSGGIGPGSWAGDYVAVTARGESGSRTLLVLRLAAGRLTLERAFELDRKVGAHIDFHSPVFIDTSGKRVVLSAVADDLAPKHLTFFVSCELAAARCRRGRELPPRRWLSLVYSPSRPAPNAGLLPSG